MKKIHLAFLILFILLLVPFVFLPGCGTGSSSTPTPTPSPTPTGTTGILSGKVTSATTGTAISGATITCGGRTTNSNSSGNYSLTLPEGYGYQASCAADGYQTSIQTVDIFVGQTTTCNFSLTPN